MPNACKHATSTVPHFPMKSVILPKHASPGICAATTLQHSYVHTLSLHHPSDFHTKPPSNVRTRSGAQGTLAAGHKVKFSTTLTATCRPAFATTITSCLSLKVALWQDKPPSTFKAASLPSLHHCTSTLLQASTISNGLARCRVLHHPRTALCNVLLTS